MLVFLLLENGDYRLTDKVAKSSAALAANIHRNPELYEAGASYIPMTPGKVITVSAQTVIRFNTAATDFPGCEKPERKPKEQPKTPKAPKDPKAKKESAATGGA